MSGNEQPVRPLHSTEPLLKRAFKGESEASRQARTDGQANVRFLIQEAGDRKSPKTLVKWMETEGLATPGVSTIGDWSRGKFAVKRHTPTADLLDRAGALVPGYPPTGRLLTAIVKTIEVDPDQRAKARVVELLPDNASPHHDGQPGASPPETVGPAVPRPTQVTIDIGQMSPDSGVTDVAIADVEQIEGPDGTRKVAVTLMLTIGVVVLVVLLVATLRGGADKAEDPAPVAPTTATDTPTPIPELGVGALANVTVDPDLVLNDDNFCTWRLGARPIPLVSVDPVTMRVDARCNFPAEPDPTKDPGVSTYSAPSNDNESQSTGRITDGRTVRPDCFVNSDDEVVDAQDNRSNVWLRLANPSRRYVPIVNLGGGYTVEQLDALGIAECDEGGAGTDGS
jgi:hypothetical protein